jgi:hypothetical protein
MVYRKIAPKISSALIKTESIKICYDSILGIGAKHDSKGLSPFPLATS